MDFDIQQIKEQLNEKIAKGSISGKVLLDRMRVINEYSRSTSAYADPNYVPFYFHLGRLIEPKSLVEIGFNLGLLSGCFFKSCNTVEQFLAFQPKGEEYYSPRLGKANVRDSYKGEVDFYLGGILDEVFSEKISQRRWDVVIINDQGNQDLHSIYLDLAWINLNDNGIIVMDYIDSHKSAGEAFDNFCTVKNTEPVRFSTRYGTGIIQK